jgi:hypothetical protein
MPPIVESFQCDRRTGLKIESTCSVFDSDLFSGLLPPLILRPRPEKGVRLSAFLSELDAIVATSGWRG